MNINVDVSEFQKAVKLLSSLVKPADDGVSGSISVTASSNVVSISASNESSVLSYNLSAGAVVVDEGSVCFQYSKVKSFVFNTKYTNGNSGCKFFSIVLDGSCVCISSCSVDGAAVSSTSIPHNRNNYVKPITNSDGIVVDSSIIKASLDKIYSSIDKNVSESMPALRGALISCDGGVTTLASTTGVILSESIISTCIVDSGTSILLPADAINIIKRTLYSDTALLNVEKNYITVSSGNLSGTHSLIIGQRFPDYKDILLKFDKSIIINRNDLLVMASQIIDTSDNDDNNRVSIDINDNVLKLHNKFTSVTNQLKEGGVFYSMDVNLSLLISALSSFNNEYIFMRFCMDNSGSVIFRCDDENYTVLISPLRRR